MFRIVFLGDIVGKSGRSLLKRVVPELRAEFAADLIIANGENAAGGLGIDPATAAEIFEAGVQVITTGNHVWHKREVFGLLKSNPNVIRPLNFAEGAPGNGWTIWSSPAGIRVAVVNAIGRVFMPQLVDCPFRAVENLLSTELATTPIRIIDFHAEATSEKVAFGYAQDGKATLVVGTHTHVQTADLRILPGGTAYISDLGMCGPLDGVIGVSAEIVVEKFRSGLPGKFDLANGATQLCGVFVELDELTGKALRCERIYRTFDS